MKKLNLAVAFALSLAIPFGAMASSNDDATMGMMGMNDIASAAVMKDIAISDKANDKAKDQVARANENRARGFENDNEVVEAVIVEEVIVEEVVVENDEDTGGTTGGFFIGG